MKYADLHVHTYFSDGTYSPSELLTQAEEHHLACVAIVDHDTVDGIEPTLRESKKHAVEVIPGIELTAQEARSEIHILGYLIDYKSKKLLAKLTELKAARIERIHKIIAKLKKLGVALKAETVFKIAGHGSVGRLHIARAMVEEGVVKSTDMAFRKYIGDKCPAYELGFRLSPVEAIRLIKEAKGIPVLAHPYTIYRDEVIERLIAEGILGMEIYYPEHSERMIKSFLKTAEKHDLLVTGGSDCHGKAKPEVLMGLAKIPYTLVNTLKEAKERLYAR